MYVDLLILAPVLNSHYLFDGTVRSVNLALVMSVTPRGVGVRMVLNVFYFLFFIFFIFLQSDFASPVLYNVHGDMCSADRKHIYNVLYHNAQNITMTSCFH